MVCIDFFKVNLVDVIGLGLFGLIGIKYGIVDYGYILVMLKLGWVGINIVGILMVVLYVLIYFMMDVNVLIYGEYIVGEV